MTNIQELQETIEVVIVEVDKAPYRKMIPNTLKAKQDIVGGYIECVDMARHKNRVISLVINEEGLLLDLPLNRVISTLQNESVQDFPIVGNFCVIAFDMTEGEAVTLTEDEIKEYLLFFSAKFIMLMGE
jgi:uncharacterized protein DUF3846